MHSLRALVVLAFACGGPTQSQLAETPTARTRATPAEAPPASSSDKDRERSVQQFDDMETTQRAHREAAGGQSQTVAPAPPPPAGAGSGSGAVPVPKKKGPAEQGPPIK
jgi:hypothetical protein